MVLKHVLRLGERPLLAFLCQHTCAFVVISDIISRYGVECVESYGPIQFDLDCSHGSNVVCSPKFILILVSRLCSGFVRLLSMTKHKGNMPSQHPMAPAARIPHVRGFVANAREGGGRDKGVQNDAPQVKWNQKLNRN